MNGLVVELLLRLRLQVLVLVRVHLVRLQVVEVVTEDVGVLHFGELVAAAPVHVAGVELEERGSLGIIEIIEHKHVLLLFLFT